MTESSSSSNDGRWLRTIELKMSYEQKQKKMLLLVVVEFFIMEE